MNGRDMPVGGKSPVTTKIFKSVCTHILQVIPAAVSLEKLSGAYAATTKPRQAKTANRTIRSTAPIKPNSSQTIANM